jgi:CDP-glucose 4,6-dehydratase
MSNVLITGINGFIGRALATECYSQIEGSTVVGLGFDQHLDIDTVPCHHYVSGDMRDYKFIRRIIGDYEINTIYHLAAQSIVRICANDPVSAYEINVMGTVNLMEAVREVGKNTVSSIVVSTSDKAVGHAPSPYTEETPLNPLYTYECTKTCQDIVARNFFHNYGLPVVVARCGNVYGPGDPNMSRIIPRAMSNLLRGHQPVLYSGVTNYVREFIYIDDVVRAFMLLSEKGKRGDAYCVGGTTPIKILDLMNLIIEISGKQEEVIIEEKNDLFKEIEVQYLNASKLNALGWTPRISLEEGLTRTFHYYGSLV